MTNYFKIGKLVATYGLKGEFILKHSLGKKTSLKNLEVFFIEENTNLFIPYFIESTKAKNNNEVYVNLDGIKSKESAHKLVQSEVWLLEKDFKKFVSNSAPISLLGFTMISKDVELGEILEVIEQPHQVVCRISLNGNDALIPVHSDSLQKIDKEKRQVYVTLPDGLLDIYTSSA